MSGHHRARGTYRLHPGRVAPIPRQVEVGATRRRQAPRWGVGSNSGPIAALDWLGRAQVRHSISGTAHGQARLDKPRLRLARPSSSGAGRRKKSDTLHQRPPSVGASGRDRPRPRGIRPSNDTSAPSSRDRADRRGNGALERLANHHRAEELAAAQVDHGGELSLTAPNVRLRVAVNDPGLF